MSSPPRPRAPLWIFPMALFPLGLGLFITGGHDIRHARQSAAWPAVEGVVLSSKLTRHFPIPAQPDITYRYVVQGQSYLGYRVWPGETALLMPMMSERAAQQVVDRFPTGAAVSVYVNPATPSDTALLPGPTRALRWMVVFTFFFLLSVLAPLELGRLMKKKETCA